MNKLLIVLAIFATVLTTSVSAKEYEGQFDNDVRALVLRGGRGGGSRGGSRSSRGRGSRSSGSGGIGGNFWMIPVSIVAVCAICVVIGVKTGHIK